METEAHSKFNNSDSNLWIQNIKDTIFDDEWSCFSLGDVCFDGNPTKPSTHTPPRLHHPTPVQKLKVRWTP